jgi:hypothetical protein
MAKSDFLRNLRLCHAALVGGPDNLASPLMLLSWAELSYSVFVHALKEVNLA